MEWIFPQAKSYSSFIANVSESIKCRCFWFSMRIILSLKRCPGITWSHLLPTCSAHKFYWSRFIAQRDVTMCQASLRCHAAQLSSPCAEAQCPPRAVCRQGSSTAAPWTCRTFGRRSKYPLRHSRPPRTPSSTAPGLSEGKNQCLFKIMFF